MVIWVVNTFLHSSSVYSWHLFLISSASARSIPFLVFIACIFAWTIPLVSLIFLKRYLVFPVLLFSSLSLHCSLKNTFFSSVQFSHLVMPNSLQPHELQHARPPCPSTIPKVHPKPCPLSWWCHLILCHPLLLLRSIFLQGLFKWVSSSHQVVKVLGFQLQHQSFQWMPRTELL